MLCSHKLIRVQPRVQYSRKTRQFRLIRQISGVQHCDRTPKPFLDEVVSDFGAFLDICLADKSVFDCLQSDYSMTPSSANDRSYRRIVNHGALKPGTPTVIKVPKMYIVLPLSLTLLVSVIGAIVYVVAQAAPLLDLVSPF